MGNWKIKTAGSTLDLEDDLRYRVRQQIGVGMATVDNIAIPYGFLDGAAYQRTRAEVRQFSLIGVLSGSSITGLHKNRGELINIIRPTGSPLEIQYHGAGCPVQGSAFYEAGLELGNVSARIEADIALKFSMFDPYFEGTADVTASIAPPVNLSNASYIVQRSATGTWSAMSTGTNGTVFAITSSSDGTVYIGGNFTTAGSVTANRIASWDGSGFSALGTGMNSIVNTIAIGPGDEVYAGGNFTTAGGATACHAASWGGSSWAAMQGFGNAINEISIQNDGDIFAGGRYDANNGKAASWTGSTWDICGSLAFPFNNPVLALKAAPDGTVYAGGDFTTANGGTACRIAQWNGSDWSAVGQGFSNDCRAIAIGVNGLVYAGGAFNTADGITVNNIAQWNGVGWSAMGIGTTSNDIVYTIEAASSGDVYAGGTFDSAGGVSLIDQVAIWNGNTWLPLGNIDLPGTPIVYAIHLADDGRLFLGFDSGGTAIVAQPTTVTVGGDVATYPIITISGSGQLYRIANYSTGKNIYFNDLTLLSGETLTLDLRQGQKTFVSTFRGNLLGKILAVSNMATWKLEPGGNEVAIQIEDTAASTTLIYRPRFWGVDGAA